MLKNLITKGQRNIRKRQRKVETYDVCKLFRTHVSKAMLERQTDDIQNNFLTKEMKQKNFLHLHFVCCLAPNHLSAYRLIVINVYISVYSPCNLIAQIPCHFHMENV